MTAATAATAADAAKGSDARGSAARGSAARGSARDTVARGILYKTVSTGLFSAMGAFIKWVGDDYPVGQIVFARSFFALIPVFLLIHWAGGLAALKTRRPGAHLRRSATGVAAMGLSFSALAMLPLADATALGFVAPLMTTALAGLLLHERVRVYRWSAVVIGFLGVLLMIQPGASDGPAADGVKLLGVVPLGVALALAGAFFTALAMISIRRMTDTEPSIAIVFYFTLACTLAGAVTLFFDYRIPTAADAACLVAIGLLGGFAQVLLTSSYRMAAASTLAPFDYTAMLWALLIGYFVFGDMPEPLVIAGAAIVIGSGIYIILRERKLGIERTRARRAGGQLSPPAV